MTREEKSYRGCGVAVIAAILLSLGLNVWLLSRTKPQPTIDVKHDTVYKDTTIYRPVPTDSQPTGKVIVLRVPYVVSETDTVHDSIDVPIPIMQKRYDDSLYTAWVSGFHPALDSIRLRLPEVTTTITRTIVEEPLITLGLQTGAGVGIITRQPDFYVGIGAQLNLWKLNINKKRK